MSLTVAEVKDLLEISSTSHDTAIAALLPLVTEQVNEYCGGAFAHQVKEEEKTFTTTGTSGYQSLSHSPVIRKTVCVTSTDRGTVYYGDALFTDLPIPSYAIPSTNVEDYALNYESGLIYIPTTNSQIGSTDVVLVTYSYIDLTGGGKLAAARVIQHGYTMSPGITSESVGSLSRSYAMGFDSYVAALLSPYKRPILI